MLGSGQKLCWSENRLLLYVEVAWDLPGWALAEALNRVPTWSNWCLNSHYCCSTQRTSCRKVGVSCWGKYSAEPPATWFQHCSMWKLARCSIGLLFLNFKNKFIVLMIAEMSLKWREQFLVKLEREDSLGQVCLFFVERGKINQKFSNIQQPQPPPQKKTHSRINVVADHPSLMKSHANEPQGVAGWKSTPPPFQYVTYFGSF